MGDRTQCCSVWWTCVWTCVWWTVSTAVTPRLCRETGRFLLHTIFYIHQNGLRKLGSYYTPTIKMSLQRHLCEDRHTLLEAVHLLQRTRQLQREEEEGRNKVRKLVRDEEVAKEMTHSKLCIYIVKNTMNNIMVKPSEMHLCSCGVNDPTTWFSWQSTFLACGMDSLGSK